MGGCSRASVGFGTITDRVCTTTTGTSFILGRTFTGATSNGCLSVRTRVHNLGERANAGTTNILAFSIPTSLGESIRVPRGAIYSSGSGPLIRFGAARDIIYPTKRDDIDTGYRTLTGKTRFGYTTGEVAIVIGPPSCMDAMAGGNTVVNNDSRRDSRTVEVHVLRSCTNGFGCLARSTCGRLTLGISNILSTTFTCSRDGGYVRVYVGTTNSGLAANVGSRLNNTF